MIAGIGIDILSLNRFRNLLIKRDPYKIAKRICTSNEFDLFKKLDIVSERNGNGNENSIENKDELIEKQLKFLSSRWTLKEASYKSLSNHLLKINWKDLEINKNKNGSLNLYPIQKDHRDKFNLIASLSHDAGLIVGVVIAQFK
ncbi:uncharacterized protein I206_105839 [Kwoniella pini CBS 10737]|uniref:4'-phosphopantetheinyl transferase domain-containing protein n=1 Tax=Kwoniella pini CBS 10737 TaxID=1296096 RepID=A0A1B9I0B3_9TREE|nr:uncharacterized protein I206_04659 [Kwoniella pini CBS 10737]OCF48972.1 hypothetical protein I206_04659 [Kwoniella pini CBS 10737]